MMNKNRLVFTLALALTLVATAAMAAEDTSNDKVVVVLSKNVCMINNRSMANEQIPVEIDGKTYYGCCPMCKEKLVKDETSRYAIDPVSGKQVDKAKAVIGALPGAAVLYFENETNLQKYNAGARAKKE
jgi:YHS domain-containing protein